jgi:hypothetical protein
MRARNFFKGHPLVEQNGRDRRIFPQLLSKLQISASAFSLFEKHNAPFDELLKLRSYFPHRFDGIFTGDAMWALRDHFYQNLFLLRAIRIAIGF